MTHHALNCCMIAMNDNLIHLSNLYSLFRNVLCNSISSGMYSSLIQKTAFLSRKSFEDLTAFRLSVNALHKSGTHFKRHF